jgi:serine racemase
MTPETHVDNTAVTPIVVVQSDDEKQQHQHEKQEYCICYQDVLDAVERIRGIAHITPVLTSKSINDITVATGGTTTSSSLSSTAVVDAEQLIPSQRNLYFKIEALQKTGSFKFRGATNAIRALMNNTSNKYSPGTATRTTSENEKSKDIINVITHSSGNHAQALALAAQLSSTSTTTVHATIVMPNNTPIVKKNAVDAYGGTIVLVDNTNEAREDESQRILHEKVQHNKQSYFIHPSENPYVIAGQGTVCYELIHQCMTEYNNTKLDIIIIPVGGGGLAAGNIISIRSLLGSNVKIILAEPEQLNDAYRSYTSGILQLQHTSDKLPLNSVADGLKTTLGVNTWPIIRDMVDDIITVSEYDILVATKIIWERLKICIEPSAGVGVAVALYSTYFNTKYPSSIYTNIGIILCGGNVDIIKISSLMSSMNI